MRAEVVFNLVAIVLGSNALFDFIKWLVNTLRETKVTPEQKAIRNILARDLLIDIREWMHSDDRSAEDWEIINNNYESYQELGGNGKIKKLYDEAAQIPTTE